MVTPEMLTVALELISKTLPLKLPLMARLAAPGPAMARLLVMSNAPLVNVMTPVTPKLMSGAPTR
jgi:hypothetical protein